MQDRSSLESLFLDNLGAIDRIIAAICRRHGLGREDADDFASWAKLELVADDYAVFRKFRGESSITTYLTVVIAMCFRDYRVRHWGRWRPSAAALRHGPLAVRLETLVHRDGLRLEQAAELLRTSGETDRSDRELATLLAELPVRRPVRPVDAGPQPLAAIPARSNADDLVRSREVEAERHAAASVLHRALEELAGEDQVVLRMHYWDGMRVVDIARRLGMPPKPLYGKIERALARLRMQLEAAGVSHDRARALLGEQTS
jgi:RNA polymerase sigma factor for flagellar operon FliA